MPDIVRDILNDLYAVEPSLAQREAELIPIIQKVLAAKPDAHLDPAFRDQLRQQLVRSRAAQTTSPTLPLFTMRKFSYALMGLLVVAVAGVGTYAYVTRTEPVTVATGSPESPRISITSRDAAAFGNFSSNPVAQESARLGESLGSGGSTRAVSDTASVSAPTSLVAPAPVKSYAYVYAGEQFTIPTASVLKRSNQLPSSALNAIVQSANLGLVDLEKFSHLSVQQIALAEDKDQGYAVSIDLRDGSVGVFQNWERWAQPLREAVGNVNRGSTLPSDDQLIAIASTFLDQYGIPRDAYGAPQVPKYFLGYGDTSVKTDVGFVQSVQVVYPLVVDGKPVVSENGYPMGLTVDIDLNFNRVTSVSNLTSLQYEASAYPLVTDVATVLGVVERGGIYGTTVTDATAQRVSVEVGTPTLGYTPSRYQIEQTNTEYLIPALVFPITKAPQGEQLYRSAIVVPLVQEILDQQVRALPISGAPEATSAAGAAAPDASE